MQIKEYLDRCVKEGAFPGAVWQIGSSSGILEKGAVGRLGEGLGDVSENTLYDLASLTKLFVTCAMMQQVQEGLARLSDPIGYFLPEYKDHPKGSITLFQLLTHTSIIPGKLQLYRYADTRERLLEAIRWQSPREEPPGYVSYTSKGYIILGEVISAIDHAALDEVVKRRVLEPLGAEDTFWNPGPELLERIAPTENCPWRKCVVRGQVHDENAVVMGGVAGHAGLFSTAGDCARLAYAMLTGEGKDHSIYFHPSVRNIMIQNYTEGKGENRGLGFMVKCPGSAGGDLMSPQSFGHTGFTGTSIWIDPVRDLYCVLLSNRIHPDRNNEAIFRVRHIFHNLAVICYT